MFYSSYLCNLQQYCDSAYNKLNSLEQKEFNGHNKNELYLEKKKKKREKETNTHALTHARAHEHTRARTHARTHTRTHARAPPPPQFQTKIQAIKRPKMNFCLNQIYLLLLIAFI